MHEQGSGFSIACNHEILIVDGQAIDMRSVCKQDSTPFVDISGCVVVTEERKM